MSSSDKIILGNYVGSGSAEANFKVGQHVRLYNSSGLGLTYGAWSNGFNSSQFAYSGAYLGYYNGGEYLLSRPLRLFVSLDIDNVTAINHASISYKYYVVERNRDAEPIITTASKTLSPINSSAGWLAVITDPVYSITAISFGVSGVSGGMLPANSMNLYLSELL